MVAGPCVALREDGRRCGKAGLRYDPTRGGVVCRRHRPRRCERCGKEWAICTMAPHGLICSACLRQVVATLPVDEGD